ncbi:hypothetical protein F4780DRAFT_768373 [Xylariomycetidae sp. FL0641]|nr:hypothetical protein F4780DRAFT_768373 [Xylariomycetidae sp. FL0641]
MRDDIAIVGLSFKLPEDAVDDLSFWSSLEERKNFMKEWPETRINLEAFYENEPGGRNKLTSRGGHFLKGDFAAFDAPFFSITPKEAGAMDPQHRLSLEESYRAFENAGMPVESLRGSRTAVFAASMSDDYTRMLSKDPDRMPRQAIMGTALSMLPNRLSWYFDLTGPSVHVDTACSSSMVALDLACQSLHNQDASMALVVGANMILGPECSSLLSNGNFLSPDGRCYSFDSRANGYARGEGIIGLVIKKVADAIHDGDTIRAVVRSIGSNQDGRTPTVSHPSADAQERLIRDVYRKAGLGFGQTRFFEAHGTGTALGDPLEAEAIGRVFGPHRSAQEPLYIGSVKGNIGHLEGSSGLAGVIKAMLVLEKGLIPPNAGFERMNPKINASLYHLQVPTETITWPAEGLRRVSVNSFGFGGTNSHVIMDDAHHYLQHKGLIGNHCTSSRPHALSVARSPGSELCRGMNEDASDTRSCSSSRYSSDTLESSHTSLEGDDRTVGLTVAALGKHTTEQKPTLSTSSRLLVWTAPDEKALRRVVQCYENYYEEHISSHQSNLDQLSFTLAARRSHMTWRTFTVVDGESPRTNEDTKCTPRLVTGEPVRSSATSSIAFIFTGQGAQYAHMGVELLCYPVFCNMLRKIDAIFVDLGCTWSAFDVISGGGTGNIDDPERSQACTTALQIALVELLKSFGITPSVVAGHSSGEVAAAYTSGAFSLESACKVAYFRGRLASKLKMTAKAPGAMLSVNLPAGETQTYIQSAVQKQCTSSRKTNLAVEVACINSPTNSTLSGLEEDIDIVQKTLQGDGIFAKKVNTGVAYHSESMQLVAAEYCALMGSLEKGDSAGSSTPMVSSVSGEVIASPSLLSEPRYWVDNLVSQVQFSQALMTLANEDLGSPITDIIEIGPHPALRRPILDTLGSLTKPSNIRYSNTLCRNVSALKSLQELCGRLFTFGSPISISAVNGQPTTREKPVPFRVDCPQYPFDHSNRYSAEGWISRDFRLRKPVPRDLGTRFYDWNPLEPKWRKFMDVETMPWAKDHVINGRTIFPATGMLVMALQAVNQSCPPGRQILGYLIRDAVFVKPILVGGTWEDSTETMVELRRETPGEFMVKITTRTNDRWAECFRTLIAAEFKEEVAPQVDCGQERRMRDEGVLRLFQTAAESCTASFERQEFYRYCHQSGYHYGDQFQLLDGIRWDGGDLAMATANVPVNDYQADDGLVHPSVLDCAIHLLLTQATKGLTEPVPTAVPLKLTGAWISSNGWHAHAQPSVRILAKRTATPGSQKLEGTIQVLGPDDAPLCIVQKITLARVASGDEAAQAPPKLLYNIEWQPQLSLLSPQQVHEACAADTFDKEETQMCRYRELLDATLNRVVRRAITRLSASERQAMPDPLRKYTQWMDHHLKHDKASCLPVSDITDQELSSTLDVLEALYPRWALVPAIVRNLPQILTGSVDALQVIFESGLAETLYRDVCDSVCDDRFRTLIGLMSHENPELRILEVGAGTGGMTRHVLSVLQSLEKEKGGNRFISYDYTDISSSFFDSARTKFADFGGSRLRFRPLDLERDPLDQGFQERGYDVVIAGSVLHATTDLAATLRNIEKVLKPGGRLVCLEVVTPESITPNFAFGVLPGWWLGRDKTRTLYPTITEQQWDALFRENGFTGNDLVLRDYQSERSHMFSILVTTRQILPETADIGRTFLVVPDATQPSATLQLDDLVQAVRGSLPTQRVTVLGLHDLSTAGVVDTDVVIFMIEVVMPFLATMATPQLQVLKKVLKLSKNMLWVSSADICDVKYPQHCLMQGFLRSVRLTLEAEGNRSPTAAYYAEQVAKVFEAAFVLMSPEVEYVFQDGQLRTARLIEEAPQDDLLRGLVSPQLRSEPLQPGPPMQLAIHMPGFLDTLEFVETAHSSVDPTWPDLEVEVEVKAWGLSFRDVLLALGRLEGDFGFDFAGVVTRATSACSPGLRPGDRVCGIAGGCMKTHLRVPASTVVKVPDSLALEAAASLLAPGITAYYALVHTARLRRGEKILIHAASGSTGQMAVHVARMIGAEVFATVGLDAKKQLLVDELGIPADHIFYSRDTSFASGIMRMTEGRGVDVLLNSLSGPGLRASWECMAPYGRFIELGKADIMANAALPMAGFSRNISFAAVDLLHVSQSDRELTNDLLRCVLDLVTRKPGSCPAPLHLYSVAETEQAFRYLQSGTSSGRIVIQVDQAAVVRRRLLHRSDWKLDPDASYVVAGGLGGLGRGIVRWMARKGARHLILLSRSGASSRAAGQLIKELLKQGVNVAAPECDVSSSTMLSEALGECVQRGMPPVRGCINAAMVLQDAVLDNMSYGQWERTIRSKVHTSLNLHQALPAGLDFFVLLSSLAGIHGSLAQSNYAAGCSAQDALARHRAACGQKAVALDLGWMRDAGIIAEVAAYQAQRRNAADMAQIDAAELAALLELYCDPDRPAPPVHKAQLLVGVVTPAQRISQGQSAPELTDRPLFAGFSYAGALVGGRPPREDTDTAADDAIAQAATVFRLAITPSARAEVVVRVLAVRLARALGIASEDVDATKKLSDYGVDSLMAVELRNWFAKDFAANVAAFDLMSGASIAALGDLVVASSELGLPA